MLQKKLIYYFFYFGRYCHFSLLQVKDEKRQINAERIMKKFERNFFWIILLELQKRISACFHGAGINIVFQKSIFFTFLESVT
jgi:uncharacterized membrane protein YdjX (TVP38/TMEM64 family)